MRTHEFTTERTLCLFAKPGVHFILESYDNPDDELEIVFKEISHEYGKHDYYAYVSEKSTGDIRVRIHFSLDDNDKKTLDVGNIEPYLRHNEQGKMVHTSLTSDTSGIDMGRRGVKWMLEKVKEFAQAQGFNPTKIGSSTRYSGARARNNPGQDEYGMPTHFAVDKKLREMFILNVTKNMTRYHLVED